MGKINPHHTIRFRNSDIHFSEKGSGDALVLLHGFLEDGRIYDAYQQRFSGRFRTIVIDLPGHGASGTLGYVHTMDDMAEAVKAVLEHLKVSKCVMIGHSMGGYVTLAFAQSHTAMLCGFGLFHSSASADSEQKKADRQRTIDLVMRSSAPVVEAAIPSLFAEAARVSLRDEIDLLVAQAKEYGAQGIVANIRGMMARPDRTEVLAHSAMPILIIHGLEDPVIATETIRIQAKLSDDVTFVELEGVGHMGYLEAPDICAAHIHTFAERAFVHG